MQKPVDRQFYSIDVQDSNKSHFQKPSQVEKEKLLDYVANNVIGKDKEFSGPFGQRRAVYLDYIASGRALSFIEDYIQKEVLPDYGNTHTTTSVTSLQTTLFRHEARDIIRNAVNASEHDSVIFTGSGSTGAIHKLIHALNLREPAVVFIGPYEHHSNILPWKETGAEIVTVRQTKEGLVDTTHLEYLLQAWWKSGRQLIGSFSAASNVTGILCDVDAVSVLLHRYGALAFWDYATAAPYVKLDMNPVVPGKDSGLMYKDAMFISCHKFVGGISTPGVLVAKKALFRSDVPEGGGGGSVFFVRRSAHRYLREPELREEGGTPNIVGSIRAGLVFQLKTAISPKLIMERERRLCRQAIEAWRGVPNLVILGNLDVDRLPVFSFLVHNPVSGLFLHYNYISALLNDLFGIQARGGCACAGPYAMELLGLCEEKAAEIEELLAEDGRLDRVHLRRYKEYSHREILRPGFTRLNLPFFLTEDQLDFVLQAVAMVAEHGWKLLPQYLFNPETGEWRHKDQQTFKERRWLGHISYSRGHMEYSVPKVSPKAALPASLQDCLGEARQLFGKAEKSRVKSADHTLMFDVESRPYRWFLLPSEAGQILHGDFSSAPTLPSSLPFCPLALRERLEGWDPNQTALPKGHSREPATAGKVVSTQGVTDRIASDGGCGSSAECKEDDTLQECALTPSSASLSSFSEVLRSAMERGYCGNIPGVPVRSGDSVQRSDSGPPSVCQARSASVSLEKTTVRTPEPSDSGGEAETSCFSVDSNLKPTETGKGSSYSSAVGNSGVDVIRKGVDAGKIGDDVIHSRSSEVTDKADSHSAPKRTVGSSRVEAASGGVEADSCGVDASNYGVDTNSGAESRVSAEPQAKRKKKKKKKKKSRRGEGHCAEGTVCLPEASGTTQGAKPPRENGEEGSHWVHPSKDIFKPTMKAMEEFSMLEDGDRVLVCLSGGKDSLSLLHTMHQYQFYCRSKGIQFEMGAVTVDPETPSYDPSPLKEYLASLGVPYFYESQCIMETAVSLPYECASICSFCSRMKRGRIYAAARREGYNVLALGQHLDDLAESFVMSCFHNGSLRTMKAHYTVKEGDLRVIRPFVYVREKDLRIFAEKNKLPVIAENCPACFEAPKERHRTKQLLASQEVMFPHLYSSLLAAMKPVMSISRTDHSFASLINNAENADDLDI